MLVSRKLDENLKIIQDKIKFERNLVIDLLDINGREAVFISKKGIDYNVIKFIKNYFGNVTGFERVDFTQSLEPAKKLDLKKSFDINDVNTYLNENKAVLILDGVPHMYGIGVDNSNLSNSYINYNNFY